MADQTTINPQQATEATQIAMAPQGTAGSNSSMPPASLTFSKFPPELRVKIQKEVFPKSRLVKVEWDEEKKVFKTNAKPPVNLSVNVEWRVECLKTYKLAFGTKESPATIPVDFSVDEVYLPDDRPAEEEYDESKSVIYKLLSTTHFDKIQFLRIDDNLLVRQMSADPKQLAELHELRGMLLVIECLEHVADPSLSQAGRSLKMMLKMLELKLIMSYLGQEFDMCRVGMLDEGLKQRDQTSRSGLLTLDDNAKIQAPRFFIELVMADRSPCDQCIRNVRDAQALVEAEARRRAENGEDEDEEADEEADEGEGDEEEGDEGNDEGEGHDETSDEVQDANVQGTTS